MNLLKQLLLRMAGAVSRDNESKVVFYHDLYASSPLTSMATPLSLFGDHIEAAARVGYRFVTSLDAPVRQAQVCLDDGFAGIWECRGFFQGLNWRPTVFLAVELIGKPGYLSRAQILELQKDGFRFQSHGWSHCPLTEVSPEVLPRETADARHWLEDMLGVEVTEICFPVGMFSPRVLEACRAAGYARMYSSIPGSFKRELFPCVVRRNLVQFYGPAEFQAVLRGGLAPFAGYYRRMHFVP